MKLHRLALTPLLTLLTLGIGCAANGGNGRPVGGDDDPPEVEAPRLEIVGPEARMLEPRAEHDIEVRYVEADGARIADATVDFAVEGAAGGATLSGTASMTDDEGVAGITLRAGDDASFKVVAVAPRAEPVSVHIDVQPMRFGDLDYTVTYDGDRFVRSAEVALFTNMDCETLNERVPAPRESQFPRLGATNTFANVQIGLPMAVYALGIDSSGLVAADACKDVTLESGEESVEIPLADLAEIVGGTYETEETFDVTEGFSDDLDTMLEAMRGLSEDPAGYLVDFVATHPSTPDWLADALSFGPTRALVVSELDNLLDEIHVPEELTELLDIGAELDRGFSGLTLRGELTFDGPGEFTEAEGNHRIHTVEMPLLDGPVSRPVSTDADLTVNIEEGQLSLPEHQLDLAMGQLVEMLLTEVLLPRLPGSPATLTEYVNSVFDCEEIAMRLDEDGGTTADVTEAVCNVGTDLLGGVLETWLLGMWDYDTLYLQGTGDLVDSDADYDRDTIENGDATARWTGEDGELMFSGTFTGARVDDETGRTHPVREAIEAPR